MILIELLESLFTMSCTCWANSAVPTTSDRWECFLRLATDLTFPPESEGCFLTLKMKASHIQGFTQFKKMSISKSLAKKGNQNGMPFHLRHIRSCHFEIGTLDR
ncbi:unnamed protein product [Ixodes persulcatus]